MALKGIVKPGVSTLNKFGRVVTIQTNGVSAPAGQLAVKADITELLPNGWLDGANWVVTVRAERAVNGGVSNINSIGQFVARVQFGTGGATSSILGSTFPGFSAAVPSETVEVSIEFRQVPNIGFPAAGTYTWDVTVHRGEANGDSELLLLDGAIYNAGTAVASVPDFVKGLRPVTDDCLNAGTGLTFFGTYGAKNLTSAQLNAIYNSGQPVPVPSGTGSVQWANAAPSIFNWDWVVRL